MIIRTIDQEIYSRYLIAKNWTEVVTILNTFSAGNASASLRESILQMPDPWPLFYTSVKPSSSFLQRMLDEAQKKIEDGDEYHRDFDWDGVGPFRKAHVTIVSLEENWYGVGFWAAYTGDASEKKLAEKCSLERALIWAETQVVTEPERDRFVFDFEQIARTLGTVYDSHLSGKQIAQHLFTCDPYNDAYVTLHVDNNLTTTLSLRSVAIVKRDEKSWKQEGSVLFGAWDTRFWKGNHPTIVIHTRKTLAERTYAIAPRLFYRKEEKEMLLARHDAIYTALQGLC